MQDDNDGGRQIRRKRLDNFFQSFKAAGGAADGNNVAFWHVLYPQLLRCPTAGLQVKLRVMVFNEDLYAAGTARALVITSIF